MLQTFLTLTVTSPVRDPIPGGSRDLPALRPRNADAGVGHQVGEPVKKSRAVLPLLERPALILRAPRPTAPAGGFACVNSDVSQILDSDQRVRRQESRI